MTSKGFTFAQLSEGQVPTSIDDRAPTTDNIELLERGSSKPSLDRDLSAEKVCSNTIGCVAQKLFHSFIFALVNMFCLVNMGVARF